MKGTQKANQVAALCDLALEKINDALDGKLATTLTATVLQNIRDEITTMRATLDPRIYKPSFARFIIDSYEGGDEVTDFLIDLSYQYSQRLK